MQMSVKPLKEWIKKENKEYLTAQKRFFNANFVEFMDYLESVEKDGYFASLKEEAFQIKVAQEDSRIKEVISSAVKKVRECDYDCYYYNLFDVFILNNEGRDEYIADEKEVERCVRIGHKIICGIMVKAPMLFGEKKGEENER